VEKKEKGAGYQVAISSLGTLAHSTGQNINFFLLCWDGFHVYVPLTFLDSLSFALCSFLASVTPVSSRTNEQKALLMVVIIRHISFCFLSITYVLEDIR